MSEASRKALRNSLARLAEESKKLGEQTKGFANNAAARYEKGVSDYNSSAQARHESLSSDEKELKRQFKLKSFFEENKNESGIDGTIGNIGIVRDRIKASRDSINSDARNVDNLAGDKRRTKASANTVDEGTQKVENRIRSMDAVDNARRNDKWMTLKYSRMMSRPSPMKPQQGLDNVEKGIIGLGGAAAAGTYRSVWSQKKDSERK